VKATYINEKKEIEKLRNFLEELVGVRKIYIIENCIDSDNRRMWSDYEIKNIKKFLKERNAEYLSGWQLRDDGSKLYSWVIYAKFTDADLMRLCVLTKQEGIGRLVENAINENHPGTKFYVPNHPSTQYYFNGWIDHRGNWHDEIYAEGSVA